MIKGNVYGSFNNVFKYTLLFIIFHFSVLNSNAQDIHFSQFESSPLNLNPSLTGFFNGDYRFVANHRKQWKSVTTPFNTFSGSFDMALEGLPGVRNRYSAGILINNDKAGDSELGLFQVAFSLSLLRAIGNDSTHFASIGLQGGFAQRSINYSELTFDEQYNGDSYNPAASNNETFSGENHNYGDFGIGLSYLFRKTDRLKAGAGISIQHLNRPKDSFFGEDIKMFQRIQGDIKADFAVASKFDLVPAVIFMSQGSFREVTGGTSLRYRISEKPGKQYSFLIGGWIRQSDAFILSTGMDFNNLSAGISYDINTSDLERASNKKGGYELSLIYIIRKVKPIGIKPPCPLY